LIRSGMELAIDFTSNIPITNLLSSHYSVVWKNRSIAGTMYSRAADDTVIVMER
jgi:hypothetical protein